MKRQKFRFFSGTSLALMAGLWIGLSVDAPAQEIKSGIANTPPLNVTAAVPRNWPPHYITNSSGIPDGFAIEAMAEIARIANVAVHYQVYSSFTKVLTALEEKQVDIVPNVGIVDFRKKFALFTEPVETFLVSAFVRPGMLTKQQQSAHWLDILKGRTTAVVVNNVAQRVLAKTPEVPIIIYENVHEAIIELIAGRVDALAYPEAVVKRIARSIGLSDKIQIAGTPIREIKRGVAIRNDKAELHQRLSFAVDQFVESEKYQEIYKKWFGLPTPYWTVQRTAWSAGGLLTAIILTMFGWRYHSIIKLNKDIQLSQEQFKDAIESISEGFVLYDKEGQLVICNNRFREFYDYTEEETRPGVHMLDLGALDINRGRVILDGPVDEYIHRRDDDRSPVQEPFIVHLTDGRILDTRDRKTSEGGIVSTQEDVTEFRLAQSELENSNINLEQRVRERTQQLQKLSLAVEQSPNAVFITDVHGTIEYVNFKFTDLTGYTADEAIGQNPRILKSDETPPEIFTDLWQTIQAGREWRGEIKDRRKDGSHFWANETIAPVTNENGKITHYVATHEDITVRKEAELAVRSALDEAEVANRAKSDLMANMSHELRTPLNAIIGFSDTMMEETFGPLGNDKYREYLGDIHHSGQHLLKLINDILDISAFEAGAVELNEENVSLTDIIEISIRLITSQADAGQVSVSSTVDGHIPILFADPRRIEQVFLNLLSNAVKFTPQGGQVHVTAKLNDDGSLGVTVADTGIGMNDEEVIKALSTFGQVDSGLNRMHEGSGLGLPLTKGLMELHGGTIEIESEKGHGTLITVTFPKERVLRNI
jgi:PAS domain S-box-containing protein